MASRRSSGTTTVPPGPGVGPEGSSATGAIGSGPDLARSRASRVFRAIGSAHPWV